MDEATARLVLRHAVARGWLPAAQAAAGDPRLVADALVRRLAPQARAELEALARPSVAPSMTPMAPSPAPPDDVRARAVAALRDAAAVDPRFAPHVGLALETKG